jgi:hypothetical protein
MRRCHLIAATVAVTVGLAQVSFYVRITELFAVFRVRAAVIVEVAACALDPVVKPAPLDLVEFAGRNFPAPLLPECSRLHRRRGRDGTSRVQSRNNKGNSRNQ